MSEKVLHRWIKVFYTHTHTHTHTHTPSLCLILLYHFSQKLYFPSYLAAIQRSSQSSVTVQAWSDAIHLQRRRPPHGTSLFLPPPLPISSSWPEFVWRRGVKEEQTLWRAACLTSDLMVYEREGERKKEEKEKEGRWRSDSWHITTQLNVNTLVYKFNALTTVLNKSLHVKIICSLKIRALLTLSRCKRLTLLFETQKHEMSGEKRGRMAAWRKQGDHQHTPTFLSSASQQTPPLSGQQVVSEGVQLVETGDAKQPVRDKRRWTRYAQHPSTHSTLSARVSTS